MHNLLATQSGWWLESVLVLSLGAALIVVAAAGLARRLHSACLQLAVWQVALVGLVAWLAIEATGAGQAAWEFARLGLVASVSPSTSPAPQSLESEGDLRLADSGPPTEAQESPEQTIPPGRMTWSEPLIATSVPITTPRPCWPALIWLLGAVAIVGRVVWSRLALARFVRRQPRLRDEVVARRVQEVADRLGIRREVRVLEAGGLAAPVAFGVLHPSVALPTAFTSEFDPQQQRAILAHELAHLAARDPAWQLLADLVCAVLWWHPAVWWMRGGLRWASEAAADEASALVPEGPSILAGCLVALGRRLGRSQRLVWLSAEGNGFRSGLGRRVERLLNPERWAKRRPGPGRLALVRAGLPGSLVLLAVLGTAWARPQASAMEGHTMFGVWRSSWQSSLGAVALAALLAPGLREAVADEGRPAPKEKPPVARESGPPPAAERPAPPPGVREGERPERGHRPSGAEGPRGRERPDGEAIHRQLQEIRERAERLRGEGKTDEADRLKDEARQLMRRLEGMRGRGGPGPEGRPEMPEPMQRFWHLRAAMDNLRAAGLNEIADKVHEQLEAIEREHPDVKRPEGGRPEGRPEGRPWQRPSRDQFQPGGPEGQGPRPGPLPELQELREQMQRMQHQMEEMREQMKRQGERRP